MPRVVFAAPSSGSGKTTVTIGVMAALQKRGLGVQGFKCGPDYIDPGYHRAVTGRVSRNLDSWFCTADQIIDTFQKGCQLTGAENRKTDIAIIEGVMGLFDGRSPLSNEGSTAEVASIIKAPVILIIDARSQARSAAALVKGFQLFSPDTKISGVICNKVGSAKHATILKQAIEQECGIPVLGCLLRDDSGHFQIPERHLGLLPALERGELSVLFEHLANMVQENIDLDQLLKIANESPETPVTSTAFQSSNPFNRKKNKSMKIAVAYDMAFNFYYPENLEALENEGAEIIFFSPLAGELPADDISGMYIGGGFPEEFAWTLSGNKKTLLRISELIENNLPVLAECGGFMVLTQSIQDRQENIFPMAGAIPGKVVMQKKLAALGYRELSGLQNNPFLKPGEVIKAHEFRYSVYENPDQIMNGKFRPAFESTSRLGDKKEDGLVYKNLLASYNHLYFPSLNNFAPRFVELCHKIAAENTTKNTKENSNEI